MSVTNGARRQTIPAVDASEDALIGAALWSPQALEVLVTVDPSEFHTDRCRHIATAALDLHQRGEAVDPVTVANWLEANGLTQAVGGAHVPTALQANSPAPSGARSHARAIVEAAAKRGVIADAQALIATTMDPSVSYDAVAEAVDDLRRDARIGLGEGPDELIEDFARRPVTTNLRVPGLFRLPERIFVTGAESAGKSYFCSQLGFQLSRGIHPWGGRPFRPLSVLLIDLENDQDELVSRACRMLAVAGADPPLRLDEDDRGFDAGFMRVRSEPELDLLRPAGRRWLMDRVRVNGPIDLLIIGPLYKTFNGNSTEEAPAAEVARIFDSLRARYGCSIMVEAHSPHTEDGHGQRTLRPFGASLWMRWPEFGLGLRAVKGEPNVFDLVQWKARAQRDWPRRLRRGGDGWMWTRQFQSAVPPPDDRGEF